MKITTVLGSPRKGGNSETLTETFLQEMEKNGAEVGRYRLNTMNIKGCQGCMACKGKSETCVVKDDLAEVLEAIPESDVVVFATPVYFHDMTAQAKTFIDRCYSYFKPDFFGRPDPSRIPEGKTIVFITSQGAPENMFEDFVARYVEIFQFLKFENIHVIRGCSLDEATSASQNADLLALAKETAEKVLAGEA